MKKKHPLNGAQIPTETQKGFQLVTPLKMAEMLNVSPATVRRQLKNPAFPRIQIGNRTRFIPDDVLNHLKNKPK